MNIYHLWFLLTFTGCIFSERIIGTKSFKHVWNVGTVLFEKNDYGKQCWSNEQFTILNSRRMFQDILPEVKVIDSQNDQYIAHLMDYFQICLESVQRLSVGKTKHLMLKALTDTLGGYLRVYILPLTRQSYYAGNIKYHNMKMLFELFDELKFFLRTDGTGWSKPSQSAEHAKIPPIVITPSKTSVACNGLITYPTHFERNNADNPNFTFKKKKPSILKRRHLRRAANGRKNLRHDNEDATKEVAIPLPFLDNEEEPNSIALPFKNDSLQSLYSETSAFVLVKYYIASTKCITSRMKTNTHLQEFNKNLYTWLQHSVRRHLDDEKWYPAFGGILRVMVTLQKSEIDSGIMKSKMSGTYQMMPIVGTEHVSQIDKSMSPFYRGKGARNENAMMLGSTEIVIIVVVSALVMWLLVGLCLVCYRFITKQSEECASCETKNSLAILYKNADYCEPDTCPSKSLRKSLIERLNEWWRNRFGRCPGGCQDYADEERCLAAISYNSKNSIDVSDSNRNYSRKQYTRSTFMSPLGKSKSQASFKHSVCYTSEESTTYSDSPTKS